MTPVFALFRFDVCDMPTLLSVYSSMDIAAAWHKHYEEKDQKEGNGHNYYCTYEFDLVSSKPTEVNDGREETQEEKRV